MIRRTLAIGIVLAATAAAPAAAAENTLTGRAILPADASVPGPFPAVPNTDPAPAPGSRQPVGGFSALIDAPGKDTYFAMPDNGFGSKANSRSFLLRLYRVRADWETAKGGSGDVTILSWITLRDPDHKIPFPIVTEGSQDRLLTGGDFDVESVRQVRDGTLWFGEEFGPFLVHTDAAGKVLEAPIPLPDVRSPDSPLPGPANLNRSNGFEGMALSKDGTKLYPTLEGTVIGDPPATHRLYTFDLRTHSYEPGYRVLTLDDPSYLVSDLTALDEHHLVQLERDNTQGATTVHKQAFVLDLRTMKRTRVLDLEHLRDPALISLPGRPGDIGLGDPFAMPYQTIESVLPIGGDRLAVVNDTNFGSRGRNPSLDDYSDFITVRVPGLRGYPAAHGRP